MSSSHYEQAKPEIDSTELQNHIMGLMGNHLKWLAIEFSEQGIVLRGTCDSFYTKQLVQEIVRKNSSLRIVWNAIVVHDSRFSVASAEQLDRDCLGSQAPPTEETRYVEGHLQIGAETPIQAECLENGDTIPKRLSTVFHPSDFSSSSYVAFVHALKIALEGKAMLHVMHADKNNQAQWDDFPSVREMLVRWKILPEGSGRFEVEKLGVSINKVITSSPDPVNACLDYFEVHDVDLIVLSVHQRDGVMRWLGSIVGERISQGSKQNTLFIPVGQSGFVSQLDGSVTLDHILIPVVKKPRGESAVRFVQDLISNLNLPTGKVTLLHVGPSETMPFVQYPQSDGWSWDRVRLEGDRTETIVKYARETDVKLIVMTTDGPDRFLDGLRGTTSERVLRKSHCPVAVIPVESIPD